LQSGGFTGVIGTDEHNTFRQIYFDF